METSVSFKGFSKAPNDHSEIPGKIVGNVFLPVRMLLADLSGLSFSDSSLLLAKSFLLFHAAQSLLIH